MKQESKRHNSGLTLIEMMTATAILAIFSVFLINFVMASNRAMAVQQTAVPVRAEAKQAMESMIKELREGDPSAAGGVTISGSAPSQSVTFSVPNQVSSTAGIQSWKQIQFSHDPSVKQILRTEDAALTVIGRDIESLAFTLSNNVITATVEARKTISGGSDYVKSTLTSQARLRN